MGPERIDFGIGETLAMSAIKSISETDAPGAIQIGKLWMITDEIHGTPGEIYIQFGDDVQRTITNWKDLRKAATRVLLKDGF